MRYLRLTAAILAVIAALAGCDAVLYEDSEEGITRPQINPRIESELVGVYEAKLYFALEGESFITAETRKINIGTDESILLALMRELMKGPSAGVDLEPCIWEGVRLIAAETDGSTVFVTFSAEFLQPPYTKNIDRKRVINNAIFCIVNTLTEVKDYTSVQILIDKSGKGRGERPFLSEVYMLESLNATLGPLVRNESVIFSPTEAISILFDYALKNNWAKVRNMLAETQQIRRPSLEDIEKAAETSEGYIKRITKRSDEIISPDGLSASIQIDVEIFVGENNGTISKNVRLIKVNGVWKVDYSSIENILFH